MTLSMLRSFLLCALAGVLAGCASTKAPPGAEGALAWVEVSGKESLEIARALSETFQAAGFQPIPLKRNNDLRLEFEKPAGSGADVLYSDWSFKKIWYRAKLKMRRTGTDTFVVTCNAYRVNERGSAHFEEEKKLSRMGNGVYQDLLNAARDKLNATPSLQ